MYFKEIHASSAAEPNIEFPFLICILCLHGVKLVT